MVIMEILWAKDSYEAVIERFFTFLASFTTKFDLLATYLVTLPS